MISPEDYVAALLLHRLQRVAPERVRERWERAAQPEGNLLSALVEGGDLSAAAGLAFGSAARFLLAGGHLRHCAACGFQTAYPAGNAGPCRACRRPLRPGILPAIRALDFDPGLDGHVRRMIAEAELRERTKERVTIARRRRAERAPTPAAASATLAAGDTPGPGALLGTYRVGERLHEGSRATSFRATDTRSGRAVCLQVLRRPAGEPAAAREARLERLRRAVALAQELEHPDLVPSHPPGTHGSWDFVVHDFVEGSSLAELLAEESERTFPARVALLAPLVEVARALHYAHCRGVVHGNLHPRNLVYTEEGTARVVDFATAREAAGAEPASGQTLHDLRGYLAPELLTAGGVASAAADVYSLGVIAHEVLTGRLPGPTPPSQLVPGTPRALDALVRRATQADPKRRPASAQEFARDLACACGLEAAPWTWRRVARVSIAFAFGVVVLAGGSGFGRTRTEAPTRALQQAWTAERAATDDAQAATLRAAFGERLAEARRTLPADDPDLREWTGLRAWRDGDAEGARGALADMRSPRGRLVRAFATHALLVRRSVGSPARDLAAELGAELAGLAGTAGSPEAGPAAALARLRAGDPAGAREAARAQGADPDLAALVSAWAALTQGDPAAAAQGAGATAPDAWGRATRARAQLAAGDGASARATAQAARALYPAGPELAVAEGLAHLKCGDSAAARAAAADALAIDAGMPEALRLLSEAAEAAGDACAAAAARSAILVLQPEAAEDLFHRGRLRLLHGETAGGRADLRAYRERGPDGPRAAEAERLLQGK